jgi:hypothetical protein
MQKGGWGLGFEKNAHIVTCSGHSTCRLLIHTVVAFVALEAWSFMGDM